MVHTRHSYTKDLEVDVQDIEDKPDHLEEIEQEERTIEDEESRKDENNENNENDEVCEPKKKRKTLISMYENFGYTDNIHRRSLRNISSKRSNKRSSRSNCYDRPRSKSFSIKDYGTLVIRRSDRQPKKVFETFNEHEIQRCIEKKHQEILALQQASMYDSIKRRRGESETQEDTDEEEGEEEGTEEEEESEEGEIDDSMNADGVSQKGYRLRENKPKTKFFQAAQKHRSRGAYAGPQSPLHNPSRYKKVPQHSSKRMRRSSSTSCSSDEEDAFERRKAKSMAQARNRCLPMNFAPADMEGVLQGREKGRAFTGSSLADVDPMTIDSKISFSDIGGLDHHIKSLKEMVVFPLVYPEVFQKFNIAPPRGVLFYGPPGTGKTLVARALANECSTEGKKVAFFMRKGADCLSKWVGESERQLRLLFDQAYCMRPSIIFFDEIDGIAPVRSTRQDQIHSSIVSTLLALMDGLDSRGEIVVIGATNRLDSIDPALRRPGRFDREFLFSLPNKPAREKILDIHTSSWQPKLSKEFISEVAEKCVGYCGADIKALCTEAALFALRRRYPQIYNTNKKLVIDTNQIKLSVVDFKNALRAITPASHRSKSSPGRSLPEEMKPLLQQYIDKAVKYLYKTFPQGKPVKDTSKNYRVDTSSNVNIFEKSSRAKHRTSNSKEQFFSSHQNFVTEDIVNRPRLLLHGSPGNGQTSYLAPSLIYLMEHLTTYSLDIPSLYGSSSKTPEEAISTIFREARRTSPSIIYIPRIDTWWQSIGETAKATFSSLLADIPSTFPVLLIASADNLFFQLHEPLQDFFSQLNEEVLEVEKPLLQDRYEYFKEIFLNHALNCTEHEKTESAKHTEVLKEASPPKPRELSSEEAQRLFKSEEATLRELRLFLRQVTWKLLADRKFKEFTKPVDLEEVDDYLDVIKEPMDLSTAMTRINSHYYHSCAHYLKDIDLIVNNCLEYNPDKDQFDKLLRNRACEMRDVAHALIYNDLDPEFEKLCIEIQESRKKRGADEKVGAPSYLKVLPKVNKTNNTPTATTKEENSNNSDKPVISNPVGSRYSRRRRGESESMQIDMNLLETIERNNRTKNPIKNNAVEVLQANDANGQALVVDNIDGCENLNGNIINGEDINSAQIDDVENVRRSLMFESEQKEPDIQEQARNTLSNLVKYTDDHNISSLERIYTQLCRILSKHCYEKNRDIVLDELNSFVEEMR